MSNVFLDILLFGAVALYFVSTLLQFCGTAFKKNGIAKGAFIVFIAGFVVHTAYTVARGVTAGRLPLANQFEFASGFAWAVALLGIIMNIKVGQKWILSASMPAAFIVLSYAALQPREINEIMPALRSAWFALHIGSAAFSYASFAIAGGMGIHYIVNAKKGVSEDDAHMAQMDYTGYRLICFGFLLLTVVILSGCVWAEQAWSVFWSWDPKETWALITWIIYAIYLHQRIRKNWRGKRMAIFAIVAVICVIFTFVGVNVLLPGLHSYA